MLSRFVMGGRGGGIIMWRRGGLSCGEEGTSKQGYLGVIRGYVGDPKGSTGVYYTTQNELYRRFLPRRKGCQLYREGSRIWRYLFLQS